MVRYITMRKLTPNNVGMLCKLFESGRRDIEVVGNSRVMIAGNLLSTDTSTNLVVKLTS